MAEAYRPLSAHSVKIQSESSTLLQTIHHMDAPLRSKFEEVNVYETPVQPKSRKLASREDGMTRPVSRYYDRNHSDTFARGVDPGAESQVERPRTAHRRGQNPTLEQSGASTSDEAIAIRPKSGYGKRRRSVVDATPNDADLLERPQSRRERPSGQKISPRTPPTAGAPQTLQRERTFYDGYVSSRVSDTAGERPPTRHERRASQASETNLSHPATLHSTTPRNTRDPAERPRTSRGRRRTISQSSDPSNPGTSPDGASTEVLSSGGERPITSRGRRRSQQAVDLGENVPEPQHGGAATDILVVDSDRPKTGRGRRRNHYNIDLSYMNPGQEERLTHETPSPPPRPPTGRRPKSSRRQWPARHPMSPSHDVDRQLVTTPVSQSRPTSALNRYAPLPAIGAAGRDTPSMNPIHIPHGAPFQQTTQPKPTSQDVSALTEQTRRLSLCNSKENSTSEKKHQTHIERKKSSPDSGASSKSEPFHQPLTRTITLPPEPAEDEERLVLAIKLPDGSRTQRAFRPSDELRLVLNVAELSSQLDFSHCELVCDAPRKVFKDLSQSIQESGLQNRTILHVQIPDEL